MRSALFALAAFAALTGAASAQTIEPVSFSPEFQDKLHDEFGEREGAYLSQVIHDRVRDALARRGFAHADMARIEISLVDARPNRPTIEQVSARPGLDMFRSLSTGGADLRAVLHGADGEVVTVEHSYYTPSLNEVPFATGTWTDAQRAIRRFAEKVADAYAELH